MLKGVFIALLFQSIIAKQGFGPGNQDWGFISVREKAHMFWWLYYTTADVPTPTEKPLIIWLQGGPGASSTALGNFVELGPLQTNLTNRNSTWVQFANILFVDNPVGTGFSYVDDVNAYTTTNQEIARDFVSFLNIFSKQMPQFSKVPIYIFAESYGGKMAVEIALVLVKAIKNNELALNFKGVGIGDSWISPIDSIMTWPGYLLNMGFVDDDGYKDIKKSSLEVKKYVNEGNYDKAAMKYLKTTHLVNSLTFGVNIYNVLESRSQINKEEISTVMNKVKQALNISKDWNTDRLVFQKLRNDFMKPVTHIVEELLNSTNITVAIYNGQLDLIVDTPGTLKWVNNLQFKDKKYWDATTRTSFYVGRHLEGYVKKYGNFAFYWINRAGHLVPLDNPAAMHYILEDVTKNFQI